MQRPLRVQVLDQQSFLSNGDKKHVKEMIRLKLAAAREEFGSVKFEITSTNHASADQEYVVQLTAQLKSGGLSKTVTTRVSKAEVLVASVDDLKNNLEHLLG